MTRTESNRRQSRIARAIVAWAVALALCALPLAAFAAETAAKGSTGQTYDYKGAYAGAITADGEEAEFEGETFTATDAGQNAALVQNGGMLHLVNGKLAKSGDSADKDACNLYGVNAIALAVGQASQAILTGTVLESTSTGSSGLFATNTGGIWANDITISTTGDDACGLDATFGGTVVANELIIQTRGTRSAAVAAGSGVGNVSLTNTKITTTGESAPIAYSAGNVELDNVVANSAQPQIAVLEGPNRMLIANSAFTCTATNAAASDPLANGIMIYSLTEDDNTSSSESALFQASNSVLHSSIDSGAMFYLTNTQASIVLSDVNLDFDSDKAKLLVAAGNGANGWGIDGKDGATATVTGLRQEFTGDIDVDSISSVELFLLEGSRWKGSSDVTANSAGTALKTSITVNIDSTSGWTVVGNSTVSNLNIEKGGTLVDADGKAVTIVDKDGNKLVDGASDVQVTVTGEFSTTVKTSDENRLRTATVDRSPFDAEFGTSTTFGSNDTTGAMSIEERVMVVQEAVDSWLANL